MRMDNACFGNITNRIVYQRSKIKGRPWEGFVLHGVLSDVYYSSWPNYRGDFEIMGWARCGINSVTGKRMGYAYVGKCAQRGCKEKIDHGLSYCCGDMHEGSDGYGCGKYFCSKHLVYVDVGHLVTHRQTGQVCLKCEKEMEDDKKNETEPA